MPNAPVMLKDPVRVIDPYPQYDEWRATGALVPGNVSAGQGPFWVASRYEDVARVLADQSFGKADIPTFVFMRDQTKIGFGMLDRDPSDHTRLRNLAGQAFTPEAIEAMRPHIEKIVNDRIDTVFDRHQMDLVEDFAYPVTVQVICDMLGVPPADHARLKQLSFDLTEGLDAIVFRQQEKVQRALKAQQELAEYFKQLVAARERSSDDDLLSKLIVAEEAGFKLKEMNQGHDLLGTCIVLLVAAVETTATLLGNGTLALLRHPDQLRRLRANPGWIGSAVEELLRYDSPVQLTSRVAREKSEIGRQAIAPGETVMAFLGSANRDPARFPEPTRLDITRPENHHVAFGSYIHHCFGAPLARLEGQIAINTLVQRLPKLELAVRNLQYRDSITLRSLTSLRVVF